MGITEFLLDYFTAIISGAGYFGVAGLMILESMVAPVPSEAVMPFAGFLWFENRFSFGGIVLFSTLGSVIGSLFSYYIGIYGGRSFINKYGKYVLLNDHHLKMTEKFFAKYGEKTIFISRFIPVVRHFISIPAGIGRMNIFKFFVYTALGAGVWNGFLAYLGYYLGSQWHEIRKYSEVIDVLIVVLILAGVMYLIGKKYKKGGGNHVVANTH
ncbi:MAG: hypothetical protein UX17_C0005G0018 [Parcubacteria group bacterium GW2011_GWC2_45_7]|nr:MAG: hypothetical protein UX17_C0005G0018 [Parcubacteria group bacterium GW2011_GWC2_45_7]